MTSDPFAAAAASTTTSAPAPVSPPVGGVVDDPFSTKPSEVKSDFPKLDDMDGELLVVQPTSMERGIPDPFNAGKTRDRITADVTVIDQSNPAVSETIKDMYLSQGALIGQLKNLVETRGMLLGVLRKHRSKLTPDGFNTPDEIDKMLRDWVTGGARGNKPSFSWKLQDFTPAQKEQAMAWYRSKQGR